MDFQPFRTRLRGELISEHGLRNDMEYKPPLYAVLGVSEYWALDSLGRIPSSIIARRLNDTGTYEAFAELRANTAEARAKSGEARVAELEEPLRQSSRR